MSLLQKYFGSGLSILVSTFRSTNLLQLIFLREPRIDIIFLVRDEFRRLFLCRNLDLYNWAIVFFALRVELWTDKKTVCKFREN